MGGLANNPKFFGTATSETASIADWRGSWNGDQAITPALPSSMSWFRRGNQSIDMATAGVFAHNTQSGIDASNLSHRTILLGY